MDLTIFLNSKGFHTFEGYSQQCPEQVRDLIGLSSMPNIHVMEIGFNAGHSAEVFLKHNSNLTLTSFDIGYHPYIKSAKEYIDLVYPNRHTLIIGDSMQSLPEYIRRFPTQKFDLIFIDGGHDYRVAYSDLSNCIQLSHKDTIIIMDDTVYRQDYANEPAQAWLNHVNEGKVVELNRVDYGHSRGMTWGKLKSA